MGLVHFTQTWLLWNTGGVRNAEQSLARLRHREEVVLPAYRRQARNVPLGELRVGRSQVSGS